MAEQLKSGRWSARRVESGHVVVKICNSEEEATDWENGK